MATWVCPACHTYNPMAGAQCMACGREHGAVATVARPAMTPPPPPTTVPGVTPAPGPPPGDDPPFPWVIVAAAVVAVLLVAAVVAIAVAKSDDGAEKTATIGTSKRTIPTTVTTTSTTTTSIAVTVAPSSTPARVVPRSTVPRVTTTTQPPVVGNDCPSGSSTEASVHIHTGSTLNFRDAPGSKKSLDRAGNGDPIRFWTDITLLSFPDPSTLRSWVIAELPNHAGRCGFTSASNILMESGTYSTVAYETDCETHEGGVVAVLLCDNDDGSKTMKVIWKARGSAADEIGTMVRNPAGLATAQRGRDLYTLDVHELRVTRNGSELVTADVRD